MVPLVELYDGFFMAIILALLSVYEWYIVTVDVIHVIDPNATDHHQSLFDGL